MSANNPNTPRWQQSKARKLMKELGIKYTTALRMVREQEQKDGPDK